MAVRCVYKQPAGISHTVCIIYYRDNLIFADFIVKSVCAENENVIRSYADPENIRFNSCVSTKSTCDYISLRMILLQRLAITPEPLRV